MRALRPSIGPTLGLCLALLAGSAAHAGVKITVEESSSGAPKASNEVLLERDRMAIGRHDGRLIFRDDLQTAWVVNDSRRSYAELNAQTMEQAKAAAQQTMKDLQAQLKNMPEAQRKQVEAMMAAQGMPTAPGQNAEVPAITYRPLGRRSTVGSWSCEMFEQQVAGRKQADFCAARLSEVGLHRDDLKPLQDFFTFTQKANLPGARRQTALDFEALSKATGYDAIPLDVTTYNEGKPVAHSMVRSIERSDIPPTTFELPAGYKKRDISKPGGGGQD
jgi:hypothetical protein